jgi:hypothetical protein
MLVTFARHTGQSLRDVIEWWDPRDVDTWIELDMAQAEEARFAEHRQEHREAQGR